MATQQGHVYPSTGDLRRFVRAKMVEREVISIRALQKLTEDAVTYASLYSFLTGAARTVERRTLVAVSNALDTPLEELIDYTTANADLGAWLWPARFNALEPQFRLVVERLAGNLLRAQREIREANSPDLYDEPLAGP